MADQRLVRRCGGWRLRISPFVMVKQGVEKGGSIEEGGTTRFFNCLFKQSWSYNLEAISRVNR